MKAKDILRISYAIFIVSLSIFVIVLAVQVYKLEKKSSIDYVGLMEKGMVSAFKTGYFNEKVDFDDRVLNQRKVFLTKDMNQKTATRIMQELSYLDSINPGEPINLYINSSGGVAGQTLVNFMHGIASPVNVYAIDWCMSACAVALAGATGKRYAYPASYITIHINPYLEDEIGKADDAQLNYLTRFNTVSENFWKRFAKLPDRFFPFAKETYYSLSPEEALKYGLIDEILTYQKAD